MEKVKKYIYREFFPVRIFLDDIKLLQDTLSDGGKVSFATDSYRYSSIDELLSKEGGTELRKLIISNESSMRISMEEGECSFFASDDSAVSRGVCQKAEQILEKRKRWVDTFAHNTAPFLAPFMFFMGIFTAIFADKFNHLPSLIAFVVLILESVVLVVVFRGIVVSRKISQIILKDKKDSPGFWEGNRGQIIVNLIFTLAAFLLGKYLGK